MSCTPQEQQVVTRAAAAIAGMLILAGCGGGPYRAAGTGQRPIGQHQSRGALFAVHALRIDWAYIDGRW